MTHAIDRIRELNRQAAQEAETLQGMKTALVAISLAAAGAMAAYCGYAASMPATDFAAYDLVQFSGTESDIVDYDLTASDCRTAALQFTAAGHTVTCELAR